MSIVDDISTIDAHVDEIGLMTLDDPRPSSTRSRI
jgi:hypothetical protein